MRRRGIVALGVACSAALALSACGGSGDDSGTASGGKTTVKVGVLTSASGTASAAATSVQGAKARFAAYQSANGKCASKLDFDVTQADDQSTPTGALTGAQKLVQQDKVFALLEQTAFFYGAAQWATTAGKSTPVLGEGIDNSPLWQQAPQNNLYSSFQIQNFSAVFSNDGDFLKKKGATTVAGVAYNNSASAASLDNGLASVKAAGLKVGYVNKTVPFGSQDVGPIVLGIMKSKADALVLTINPDTALGIIGGLKQAGYNLKATISPTGYGGALLQSQQAVQASQGVSFLTSTAPVELNTPATKTFQAALKQAGTVVGGIPDFFQTDGWLSADLLIHGLELNGCNADQASFQSALRKDTTWDGGGLYPDPIPMNTVDYPKYCFYMVTLQGKGFVVDKDAAPLCGTKVGS